VGGFLLEARVGSGSFGTVYRARRGGRPYALKFLHLPSTERWAWRELEVLLRLRRVGWVAIEGHGLWPDQQPRFLFLALPHVEGRPLFEWARRHDPTARRLVEQLRPLARQIGEAHRGKAQVGNGRYRSTPGDDLWALGVVFY
jgi:serine/threonine protein kinase